MKEIVEVMHEDADITVKLAGEPTIKGKRKSARRRLWEKHTRSAAYKRSRSQYDFVDNLSDDDSVDAGNEGGLDSVGSSISEGGLLDTDLDHLMD